MKSLRRTQRTAIFFTACAIGAAALIRPLATAMAASPAGAASAGAASAGGSASSLPNGSTSTGQLDASTSPSDEPSGFPRKQRSINEIIADYRAVTMQLQSVVTPKAMTDAAARDTASPKAIPILYHHLQIVDELAGTHQVPVTTTATLKLNDQALLYMFNDVPTVGKVKGMLASGDANRKIEGQSIDLMSRWMTSASDKVENEKVLAQVITLDHGNPSSTKLTIMTLSLADSARTPEAKDQLQSLVTDVMTDPYARHVKAQITAEKEAAAKQASMMNKTYAVVGKTIDGKDFTTGDWKGKVVLVDFWATWCGPCKEGLPHVKEIYSQYHDKGLEIIGVSNDYDASALSDFTPKNNMPWPQLFDADAAASHKWNPITLNNGIHGIPTMFLVDKKGMLRSVTARGDMDTLIPKLLAE